MRNLSLSINDMLGPLLLLEKNPPSLLPFVFKPLFVRSQNPHIMEEPNPLHCLFQIHQPLLEMAQELLK